MSGVAGVLLGAGHPLADALVPESRPRFGYDPSWAVVLLGIATFVMQYGLSGSLEQPLMGAFIPGTQLPALDALLLALALLHYWTFDRSRQGLLWALATALGGPLIEIFLINGPQLYHYEHPQAGARRSPAFGGRPRCRF